MEMNQMLPDLLFKLGRYVDNHQKKRAELQEKGVKVFNPAKQLWWVPVVVCLTLLITRPTKPNLTKTQSLPVDVQLTVGTNKVDLERPQTLEQRNIGLMGRKTIADDRGMLILLSDIARPYKINMTNIGFPVDFVFVNGITVVKIVTLQPCDSRNCPVTEIEDKSSFLIQMKAGTAQKLGLKQGSKIKISKRKNS